MSNGIQKSNGEVIFSQDLSVQIFYIGMSLPGPEDSISFSLFFQMTCHSLCLKYILFTSLQLQEKGFS